MKKILVPLDFSDYSMNALEVATYVAKVKDLHIRLIHAVEDTYSAYYNMAGMNMIEDNSILNYRQELENNVKEKLAEIASKLIQQGFGVETNTIMDSPHRAILNELKSESIELVVMGSHGHSEIEEIFLGGTTERVIRSADVPVLSVHKIRKDYKIDRIVFASDFEDDKVEPILQRVIRFAEIFMAELFLVRINAPAKLGYKGDSRHRLDELSKKFKLSAGAVTSYSDKSEEEGIVNYAKEINADLITMATHGRTGLARLFKGSLAEEIAGFSEIPVLTYNIAKERVTELDRPPVKKTIRIVHSEKDEKGKIE